MEEIKSLVGKILNGMVKENRHDKVPERVSLNHAVIRLHRKRRH